MSIGNNGGRPSKYDDETVGKVKEYMENHEGAVPSIAGLALFLEVGKSTIYDWSNDPEKSQFSDMLAQVLVKQEDMLLSGGLLGDMNPTIAKLMLTKHGYSDKIEQRTETIELSHEQWLDTLD